MRPARSARHHTGYHGLGKFQVTVQPPEERPVRQVGHRKSGPVLTDPSGESLAAGARFSESISALAQRPLMRKGVYRFRSQADANRHWLECVASAMAMRIRRPD